MSEEEEQKDLILEKAILKINKRKKSRSRSRSKSKNRKRLKSRS